MYSVNIIESITNTVKSKMVKGIFKDPLHNHLSIAIVILCAGVLIAFLLPVSQKANGKDATIIMSSLAFAFSYYQFFYNKIEAEKRDRTNQELDEKRRLEELKLIAYKDIMRECNELVYNATSILAYTLERGMSIKTNDKEFISIQINTPHRINSLLATIRNYESLLVIKIDYRKLFDLLLYVGSLKSIDQAQYNEYYEDLYDSKVAFNKYLLTTLTSQNPGK